MYAQSYYQGWLSQLEVRELELVGIILAIDTELYEIQKVIRLLREMGEEEDFLLGSLLLSQIRLRNTVDRYRHELAEITLDISHCRFMIAQLNK